MKIDIERIQRYLGEIKARHSEIEELLLKNTDQEILKDPWRLRGLKYILIEIAEAMANTLQHILAKERGEPVTGYVETIIRAGETAILSETLSQKIKPFFDFRNSLIHRYWFISDEKLLTLVRENKDDFISFIEAIESYIRNRK
ncbi:MAG: DUF86 domain-containing protein [Syntrophaceae bacterium]|nr:DUF86 domain-containing protein [Syntrophaceae bacterium]